MKIFFLIYSSKWGKSVPSASVYFLCTNPGTMHTFLWRVKYFCVRWFYSYHNWENWNYCSKWSPVTSLVSFQMKGYSMFDLVTRNFTSIFLLKEYEWGEKTFYFKMEGEQFLIFRASKTFRCHFLLKSVIEIQIWNM